MNSKVERFISAIRPPTPAKSDNPLSWIRPGEHFEKYHDKVVTLTDGELTAEVARYGHSLRTNLVLGGLNIATVVSSAVIIGHFHGTAMEWLVLNEAVVIFNMVRGMTREHERGILRIEKQYRADLTYR